MYFDPISQILFNSLVWLLRAIAVLLAFNLIIALMIALGGVIWSCFSGAGAPRKSKRNEQLETD